MADRGWTRQARVAAAVLAGTLLLAGCGGSDSEGPPVSGVQVSDDGFHGSGLGDNPFVIPDLPLTDTDGAPYSIAEDPTPVKVVFFGYTFCPDICQAVMSTVSSAVRRLDDEQRSRVRVVFVTTDPARDTGRVLREYLQRFGDDFVGLTGDLDDIVELGDAFKVAIADGRKLPSGGYEVDHTTYTYGMVGDGAQVIWNSTISPADLHADLAELLKS